MTTGSPREPRSSPKKRNSPAFATGSTSSVASFLGRPSAETMFLMDRTGVKVWLTFLTDAASSLSITSCFIPVTTWDAALLVASRQFQRHHSAPEATRPDHDRRLSGPVQ